MRPGALALADGTIFTGTAVGAPGLAAGEVVFNTAACGYQEIMTDPSYAGQVITFTTPHVGNYGVTEADDQSDTVHASGIVVRSVSLTGTSWRSDGDLDAFLARRGVVALSDVDTRRLTRHIRRYGSMAGAIGADVDATELIEAARAVPPMAGRDLVAAVTTAEVYRVEPEGATAGHVVAYDLGVKRAILSAFTRRGIAVTVVPAGTPARDVLDLGPDGVFLSNGPGDPEPLVRQIDAVRSLLGEVPIFGICLGHQILALALGARTYKLPFGHHGGNHPVRRTEDGKVEITAQNHGFAVDPSAIVGTDCTATGAPGSPYGTVEQTHENLNDGTNEGLACRDVTAFSVQYHPEAAPGPNDAVRLFDRFAAIAGKRDA